MKLQFSYSSLKKFTICPKQYQEVKLKKNFVDLPNEQAIYGKSVHKALEEYVRDGKPLPKNYQVFQNLLDVLINVPGKKYTEMELALGQDKLPCAFTDPEYFCRGIVDLLIVDSAGTGFILDYKTGNPRYADSRQLKLLTLLVFAHLPHLEKIRSGLIFISNNQFMPSHDYTRTDIPALWDSFAADLMRLAYALKTEEFMATPNGLCRRYCPVTSCGYCGR